MTPRVRIPFLRDPRTCEEVRSLMTDYLDRDLEPASLRRVERHVRFCPRCRRVISNLRTTIERLAHLEPPAPAGDEVIDRIRTSWRDRDE